MIHVQLMDSGYVPLHNLLFSVEKKINKSNVMYTGHFNLIE